MESKLEGTAVEIVKLMEIVESAAALARLRIQRIFTIIKLPALLLIGQHLQTKNEPKCYITPAAHAHTQHSAKLC